MRHREGWSGQHSAHYRHAQQPLAGRPPAEVQ
nr:MAG TPA: hypothetical protein [Caudoviricetes sp.]